MKKKIGLKNSLFTLPENVLSAIIFLSVTLPIIGTSLVDIFGVTLFMILIVYLLNLISNYGIKKD